jgi:hypothetical protein
LSVGGALIVCLFCWLESQPAVATEPSEQWGAFNAYDDFKFLAPIGTRFIRERGTDSDVGRIVGPGFWIGFDFGEYSSDLSEFRAQPGYVERKIMIDGHVASFISVPNAKKHGGYAVGLHVKDFSCSRMVIGLGCRGWVSLTMVGSADDSEALKAVRRLFGTITFTKRPFD